MMLTPENKTNKTCNQQLLHLYRVHRPHLLTLLKRGKETWDNVTTIEHKACKFYRLVKYCTAHPKRRVEFWKIVGREDLAEFEAEAVAGDEAEEEA